MAPELMSFQCTQCLRVAQVDKRQQPIGKQMVCKGCGQSFTLLTGNLVSANPPATPQVKLLKFACNHCQRIAQVQEVPGIFGKKMLCKGCKQPFTLSQDALQVAKPTAQVSHADNENTIIDSFEDAVKKASQGDDSNADMAQGKLLGGYPIGRLLGKGGMGKVYEVYDPHLNIKMALKVLTPGLADDDGYKRFLREAKTTSKLEHSNIVRVYDVGIADDQYYFTMEIVNGESLEEALKSSTAKVSDLLKIIIKVGEAMDYAHSLGVIHRDLKPANIMLNQENEPKIMDFGLAKMTEESNQLTATGTVLGTLAYMPPEQAKGEVHEIDQRCDIYAIGIILYRVLTGKVPFDSKMALKQIMRIVKEQPAPPCEVNKDVPQVLSDICLKAIEKQRENRYQSASELVAALQPYVG